MGTQLDVAFGRLAVSRGMITADAVREAWRVLAEGQSLKDALVQGGKLGWAQAEGLEAELRSMAGRRGVEKLLLERSDDGSGVFAKPMSDSGPLPKAADPGAGAGAGAGAGGGSGSWDLMAGGTPVRAPASAGPSPSPNPAPTRQAPMTSEGGSGSWDLMAGGPPARSSGTFPAAPRASGSWEAGPAAPRASGSWEAGPAAAAPPPKSSGTFAAGPSAPPLRGSGTFAAGPAAAAPRGSGTFAVGPAAAAPRGEAAGTGGGEGATLRVPSPAEPAPAGAAPAAAAPTAVAGELPRQGELLGGRYRLGRVLGKGGMGAVFEAQDEQLRTAVAVKVVLPAADPQGALLRRFQREAEALARVSHPGVVRIRELGEHSGMPFAVMDLVRGQDLKKLLETDGPLPVERALDVMAAVGRAVEACHQAGVLHRDLKPHNVLVRAEDDAPLVTDFGLALHDEAERLTRTGELLGTPAYMSPEQAEGDKQALGPRTDVYALGATLYELVSGRPPFHGNPYQVLKQVFSDMPPPPSRLRQRVPAGVDAICLKALAKDPARRYASAGEFADDVARQRRGEPIRARIPSRAEVLRWRLRRRDPRAWGLVGLLVLAFALMLAGGVQLWARSRAGRRTWDEWRWRLEAGPALERSAVVVAPPGQGWREDYLREVLGDLLPRALDGDQPFHAMPRAFPSTPEAPRALSALALGLANVGHGRENAPEELGAGREQEGIAALASRLAAAPLPGLDPRRTALALERLLLRLRAAHGLPWRDPVHLPGQDYEVRLARVMSRLGWLSSTSASPELADEAAIRAADEELGALCRDEQPERIRASARLVRERLSEVQAQLASWRAAALELVGAGRAGAKIPPLPGADVGELGRLRALRFEALRPELVAELVDSLSKWVLEARDPMRAAAAVEALLHGVLPDLLQGMGLAPPLDSWVRLGEQERAAGRPARIEAALVKLFRGVAGPLLAALKSMQQEEAASTSAFAMFRALTPLIRPEAEDPAAEVGREAMLYALITLVQARRKVPVSDAVLYLRFGGAGIFGGNVRRVLLGYRGELDAYLREKLVGDALLLRAEVSRAEVDLDKGEGMPRQVVDDFALALGPDLDDALRARLGLPLLAEQRPLAEPLSPCWRGFARWKLARCLLARPGQGGRTDPLQRRAAVDLMVELARGVATLHPTTERSPVLSQALDEVQAHRGRCKDPELVARWGTDPDAEALAVLEEPLARACVEQAWADLDAFTRRQATWTDSELSLYRALEVSSQDVWQRRVVNSVGKLAQWLQERKRLEEARQLVEEHLTRLRGLDPDAWHELARIRAGLQAALGAPAAADATLREVIDDLAPRVRRGGGSAEELRHFRNELDLAAWSMAELRLGQGDVDGAVEMLKLALEDGVLDPLWDKHTLPRLNRDRKSLGNPAKRIPE